LEGSNGKKKETYSKMKKIFKTPLHNWIGRLVMWLWVGPALAQTTLLPADVNQSIFPPQSLHVHGSSLVNLPNGDLLAVWFQGSGERTADDVLLMGSRKNKNSESWTTPFLMADTPGIPDCNPVLFLNQKNELFLVWIAVLGNRWEQSVLRVRRSTDFNKPGAPNWYWQDNILLNPGEEFVEEVNSRFKELPNSHQGWAEYAPSYQKQILEAVNDSRKRSIGWMTRIKPLISQDRIILPLYSDGFNFSLMAISDDQGESWTSSKPLVGKGPIQPALARRKNGEIVAMLRDSGDGPTMIQQSISKDNGLSWRTAQKTGIPNTASVELLVLKDGRWWMVGNDLHDGRYRLALWISTNEGETWSSPHYLAIDPDKKGGFSYPSLIQDATGQVHLSYSRHFPSGKTIQYLQLDPKKIQ
jgi:predicted neuraminidase